MGIYLGKHISHSREHHIVIYPLLTKMSLYNKNIYLKSMYILDILYSETAPTMVTVHDRLSFSACHLELLLIQRDTRNHHNYSQHLTNAKSKVLEQRVRTGSESEKTCEENIYTYPTRLISMILMIRFELVYIIYLNPFRTAAQWHDMITYLYHSLVHVDQTMTFYWHWWSTLSTHFQPLPNRWGGGGGGCSEITVSVNPTQQPNGKCCYSSSVCLIWMK